MLLLEKLPVAAVVCEIVYFIYFALQSDKTSVGEYGQPSEDDDSFTKTDFSEDSNFAI